jgi:hypothetical protein
MAQIYDCDRCRKQVSAEGEDRREWTAVALAKVTSPGVPFQKMDLCDKCTGELRHFFQAPGVNE